MNHTYELARFKKSLLLHASRYNLYSQETLTSGSTKTHNQAVKALGKLEDKVLSNPLLYSDLLFELLQDSNPKISLAASFICLSANLHAEKAMSILAYIGNNTQGLSMICDFDIRGAITRFKKQQLNSMNHNEVDEIAKKMECSFQKESYTDEELFDMVLNLPNINMCGYDGKTTLIHACIFNRITLVRRMLELGADVSMTDRTRKSALHCAVIVGNTEIITLLLNHQANVNTQDERGFTALDFAKGNFAHLQQNEVDKIMDLLISYGAKNKQEMSSNN